MPVPSPFASIPEVRADRWLLLREAISQWYPPLKDDDGVSDVDLTSAESRLGVSLPIALREWYLLSGRRDDLWSRQDHFLPPTEFRLNGEYLVFMIENQYVIEWGIRIADLELVDPPVYTSSVDDANKWLKENDSVSGFALQWFAYCLKWSNTSRWWANAFVGPEVLESVAAHYPRLPFNEWHWPTATRFYGVRDLIVEAEMEPGEHAWLFVVARTFAAAEEFKQKMGFVSIEWNTSSDEWPSGWVSSAKNPDD